MRHEIPHIDPSLLLRLKIEARHRGLDVSDLLKEALLQFLGLPPRKTQFAKSSKLAALAGTWSSDDLSEFKESTKAFGEIDPDLWK
ncbi:MAG: hypothetical protein AAFR87_11960 [Bacteroidota bacterium]